MSEVVIVDGGVRSGTGLITRVQKLNLFISYAHEDSTIATAAYTMLKQTFGEEVLADVFLDKKSIHAGDDIAEEIQVALKNADVLLVISTGQLKDTVSWTGWEVGFFDASHQPHEDPANTRGKVITFCRVKPTGPNDKRRYVSLGVDESLVEESEESLEKKIEVDKDDDLVVLLGDIHYSVTGEKLDEREDLRNTYRKKVKEFKKAVYVEFKSRIKNIRKPQKQLIIRYSPKELKDGVEELPSDTQITSVGAALEVFGISEDDPKLKEVEAREIPMLGSKGTGTLKAKAVDWVTFRNLISKNELAAHWASTLSRVVLSVSVNADNSQVIASHDKTHRYRVVLTTGTTYYNGEVEASVYLVEATRPPDYGNENTTLLLKGLHIVCRFRFLFLEPQSDIFWFNLNESKAVNLPNLARQIIAELNFLHIEANNAKLDNPGSWAAFVPLKDLDAMIAAWEPLGIAISALCTKAINQSGNQEELEKTQAELKAMLKLVAEQVSPHNATLLRAMSAKLAELAEH